MDVPELVVAGSPRQRGLQHGSAYPQLIRGCFERFCEFKGASVERIDSTLQKIEEGLRRSLPETLEEIEGIAQGAGMSYEEIMQLNFCEEIWNATTGWCTCVCLTQSSDGPLLGKTDDGDEGDEQYHIFQRVENPDGYSYIRCIFVGTLWTCAGVNEVGLAFASSALVPAAVDEEDIIGAYPLFQACMERCRTVTEARHMISSFSFGIGRNILLVDAEGNAVEIEKLPGRQELRYPEEGVIFHTNQCISEGMSELLVDDQERMDNSSARYELLRQATRTMPRNRSGMESLLRRHSESGSICQHGGGCGRFYTLAAYVVAPRQKQLWVAQGPPCRNKFACFSI